MARKSIVVAVDTDKNRFVLNPTAKDGGDREKLSGAVSDKVREYVREYVEADARPLPYHELLKANKRVGIKLGNGMVPSLSKLTGIKVPSKSAPAPAPRKAAKVDPAPDVQAEAEARNAKIEAARALLEVAGLSISMDDLVSIVK